MVASWLFVTASLVTASVAQVIKLEAEDGVLTGVTVATSEAGYTGTGYVTGFVDPSYSVVMSTSVDSTTLYDLTIAYNSQFGPKNTYLLLNGATAGEIELNQTTTWANASAGRVLLNAGNNIIGLQDDWGYYDIDYLLLSPTPPPPPHQATEPPVNPNVTPEAASLLKYVQQHYGTDVLAGQQGMHHLEKP